MGINRLPRIALEGKREEKIVKGHRRTRCEETWTQQTSRWMKKKCERIDKDGDVNNG